VCLLNGRVSINQPPTRPTVYYLRIDPATLSYAALFVQSSKIAWTRGGRMNAWNACSDSASVDLASCFPRGAIYIYLVYPSAV
jgi:hypothetical protein